MRWSFVLLLALCATLSFSSFASAIDASFSCPDTVYFDEEFVCTVDASSVDSIYDVKFYIKAPNGTGINRIFDGEKFRRADWYLQDWIDADGSYDIRLIIHKEHVGSANGEFKLRDSSGSIVVFENFKIEVGDDGNGGGGGGNEDPPNNDSDPPADEEEEEEEEDNEEEDSEDDTEEDENEERAKNSDAREENIQDDVITSHVAKKVINLNFDEQRQENNREVVYKSKHERIKDFMMYAFMGFLIAVIALLLLERRR